MPIETWEALVDPYFRSLRTDYHCVIADRSDEDWWSTRIVYQNTTTAAEISYSVEFERVEVQLVRLVGEQRPPYPIFIAEQSLLHHFLLDSLLRLRAPELLRSMQPKFSLEPHDVPVQLSLWSAALKEFGADVLRGDFSVFDVLESDLRDHVRRNPEQLQVWVPRNAGDAAEDDRSLARVRRMHPAIPGVVREYSRPMPSFTAGVRRFLRIIVGR